MCDILAIDKPGHLDLVGPYKQIPTDDKDTTYICDNHHKDTNEGLHYFKFATKKEGKLILGGEKLLNNMIRFTRINFGTKIDAYISSSLNVDLLQDQDIFILDLYVEDLNSRDIALVDIEKGPNKNSKEESVQLGGNKCLDCPC